MLRSNVTQRDWDLYFMHLAKEVATNSKCASRNIGSIITRDNRILSTGYNGPPSGILPCYEQPKWSHLIEPSEDITHKEIFCPRHLKGYKSGEGLEWCPAAHAETNAIVTAARMGINIYNTTMYVYCPVVCRNCASLIINAGIKRLVILPGEEYNNGIPARSLLNEAEVEVVYFEER